MRFVFAGSSPYSLAILTSCLDADPSLELAGILTQPDRRGGRKMSQTIVSPLAQWANDHGVPVCKTGTLHDYPEVDAFLDGIDFVLVASYGLLVPTRCLARTRFGWWNIHPSALPRHRGASPLHATILAGDVTSAVCLMLMESGLDTGGIMGKAAFNVPGDTTVSVLENTTAPLAGPLVRDAVAACRAGSLVVEPQADTGITMTRKIHKQDGRITVSDSAQQVLRKARAYTGWPGIYVETGTERVQILDLGSTESRDNMPAGTILAVADGSFDLQLEDGAIRIYTLKRAGKSAVDGSAFCAGARVQTGDRIWVQ